MLTLRQLQCLSALADTLHFGRAAERIHISQPALSSQIALLEEDLGVLLVERTKRRVLLTPSGREVAERAKRILRDIEDLRTATRSAAAGPLSGTLRLGTLPTLGSYLLNDFLGPMRQRYPDLRLYLREEPADRLAADLTRGDLDLLLVDLPHKGAGVTVMPLLFEPLWAALPLGHPLAERENLAPADLAGEKLILMEAGHDLRDIALGLAEAAGAAEDPDFRATSLDSLRRMCATGVGVTLLPALYVEEEALTDPLIAVRPFAAPEPGREVGLVWRRASTRAAEFRLLGELIREFLPPVVWPVAAQP
jgi:LysR family hydrogen peroxide-inducible transcriptional activator